MWCSAVSVRVCVCVCVCEQERARERERERNEWVAVCSAKNRAKDDRKRRKQREISSSCRQQSVSALWCLDVFLQNSRQPLRSPNHAVFFFFFLSFRERGAIAGSMCATSRVANITSPPPQELWRCGKVVWRGRVHLIRIGQYTKSYIALSHTISGLLNTRLK